MEVADNLFTTNNEETSQHHDHDDVHIRDQEQHLSYDLDQSFTIRSLLVGLLLGILINLSNTYYGLRVCAGSQMSMVSGLLGFIGFKLFSQHTTIPFTAVENVLVISVATATKCIPLTASFISITPTLEYLIDPHENGPLLVNWESLVMWSMDLCFFGLIFASLLRRHFVVQENLLWPGPKANAQLLNTLHRRVPVLPKPSHTRLRFRRNFRTEEERYRVAEGEPWGSLKLVQTKQVNFLTTSKSEASLAHDPKHKLLGRSLGHYSVRLSHVKFYKLYASQSPIPGPLFRVPSSFLVLSTARLVMGRGFLVGIAPFAAGAAVISMLVTIIKMRYVSR